MAIAMTSCEWFKNDEQKEQPTVESYIESDMEYVTLNYDSTFAWYETEVVYNSFLDEENDGSYESVRSVFQYEKETDTAVIVKAIIITHTEGVMDIEVVDTWYLEDLDLRNYEINLTFADAYDAMMAADIIKPHTQHCVLRSQVGPVLANPQYIYGKGLLFVDATNGEVSEINPVFPDAEECEDEMEVPDEE